MNNMEMVTISKKEYEALKRKAKVNDELMRDLVAGLEDVKAGRIKPLKHIS